MIENELSFDYNEDLYYIYSEYNKDDKSEKVLKKLIEEEKEMSIEEFEEIYSEKEI